MDKREKRIVFLCHCILNQNTVVEPLARAKGGYNQIISEISKRDIGIHQMICPEFEFLGPSRKPMNYDEYDALEGYRQKCQKEALKVYENMKKYLDSDYKIIGIIGINESPTCSISGQRGVYMEELFKILEDRDIKLPSIEVSTKYMEDEQNDLKILIDFLDGQEL